MKIIPTLLVIAAAWYLAGRAIDRVPPRRGWLLWAILIAVPLALAIRAVCDGSWPWFAVDTIMIAAGIAGAVQYRRVSSRRG